MAFPWVVTSTEPGGLTVCIVYVECESRVNFLTIFGDLYPKELWVICNNLNQFANLSSASGPRNDVIKMAPIVLICTDIRHRI